MFHTEQQYKILEQQLQKMKKEYELKEKEIKLLKKQNKEKDEVIHDLDRYNYRGKYLDIKEENQELKKKLNEYEIKLGISKISLEKDSSNSCKPSSTNGFKVVPLIINIFSRQALHIVPCFEWVFFKPLLDAISFPVPRV